MNKMRSIDELLKINITDILKPVSEETVNNIIHVVKYIGVESLSDLQFVQDEDLISVLKPIQRRKLIRAWNDQGSSLKEACSYSSVNLDTRNVQSHERTSIEKATEYLQCDDIIKLEKCNENKCQTAEIQGKNLKDVCSYSSVNLDTKTDPSHEQLSAEKATECLQCDDIIKLENCSDNRCQTAEIEATPVKLLDKIPNLICKFKVRYQYRLLQIYTRYKTKLSAPTVNEQKVWQEIASEFNSNISISHDASQCFNVIKQLRCEYEEIKKRDANSVREAILTDLGKIAFETTNHSDNLYKQSKRFVSLKWTWTRADHFKLLQVYAKYRTELFSPNVEDQKVWEQIANEVSKKNSPYYGVSRCRYQIHYLQSQYEKFKRMNSKHAELPYFFNEAKKAFDESPGIQPAEILSTFVKPRFKWSFTRSLSLLEAYTKYKLEFTSSDIDQQILWSKISFELTQRFSLNYDELSCRTRLDELRCEYEKVKNEMVKNQMIAVFLDIGKRAFETTENTVYIPVRHYKLKRERNREFRRTLLEVYSKYKTEFTSGVEEHKIWEKILLEMRENEFNYGESLCKFQLSELKKMYERFVKERKGGKPYFFDKAREAFEINGNAELKVILKEKNTSESPETGIKRKVEESEELLPEASPKKLKCRKKIKKEK